MAVPGRSLPFLHAKKLLKAFIWLVHSDMIRLVLLLKLHVEQHGFVLLWGPTGCRVVLGLSLTRGKPQES